MEPHLWTPGLGYPDGARARDYLREERARARDRWRHVRDPRLRLPLRAAIALVTGQKIGFTQGTGTAAGSLPSSITAGNAVIVGCIGSGNFSTADFVAGSVVDGLGNTYTRHIITTAHPTGWVAAIFSCLNVVGGACTLTITNSASASPITWGAAAEFSGLMTAAALDQTAVSSGGTGPLATGTLGGTTTQNVELEIALLLCNNPGVAGIAVNSFTPAYAQIAQNANGDACDGEMDYRILSATTNVGATWSGPNFDYSAVAATFLAAASGSGAPSGGLLTCGAGN